MTGPDLDDRIVLIGRVGAAVIVIALLVIWLVERVG